jgi:hypothetical protein
MKIDASAIGNDLINAGLAHACTSGLPSAVLGRVSRAAEEAAREIEATRPMDADYLRQFATRVAEWRYEERKREDETFLRHED